MPTSNLAKPLLRGTNWELVVLFNAVAKATKTENEKNEINEISQVLSG